MNYGIIRITFQFLDIQFDKIHVYEKLNDISMKDYWGNISVFFTLRFGNIQSLVDIISISRSGYSSLFTFLFDS